MEAIAHQFERKEGDPVAVGGLSVALDSYLIRVIINALCQVARREMLQITWKVVPFPGVNHLDDVAALRDIARQLEDYEETSINDLSSYLCDFPHELLSNIPSPKEEELWHSFEGGFVIYQVADGRVTLLEFQSLHLKSLPPAIGHLPALKTLRVQYCKLEALPPWIGQLGALRELDLGLNSLTVLPPTIGELALLEVLNLGGNHLATLPVEVGTLAALRVLALSMDTLENLPITFKNLPNLEDLTVFGVKDPEKVLEPIARLPRLRVIRLGLGRCPVPTWLHEMTTLRELTLGLSTFNSQTLKLEGPSHAPNGITLPPNLEVLDLNQNMIEILPDDISCLQHLKVFNLYRNLIKALPEAIRKLHRLENLNLTNNLLATLPECLGELYSLKELNLSMNQLASLPESICELESLEWLDINSNRLTSLPECIGRLPRLTFLDIHGNRLESLPSSLVNRMSKGPSLKIVTWGNPFEYSLTV